MRKVFLENLSHKGKFINWKASIGCKVKFIYDNIEGEVEIVDYKNAYLSIKYLNKESFKIRTGHFTNCNLGNVLDKKTSNYKYQIGDIITDVKSGKLKILEQIRIKYKNTTQKGYKYECLICGNVDIIGENSLNRKYGCNVCCKHSIKVLKGYNDMWTTNLKLAKLLLYPEDGYKYMQNSNVKVDWKCPDCGEIIKNKLISQINKYGLSCVKCGDGISKPEKFMYNVLEQLNIEFIYQLNRTTLNWCDKYKYDFYIPNLSIIIETHGGQHYEKGFKKTLKEIQVNDKLKKELAIKNGIKEENYIIINCKESNLEYIKKNIMYSLLPQKLEFNEETINWKLVNSISQKTLVKEACDLWNSGIHSTMKISKELNISNNTIIRYLKQGVQLNWCDYDPKKEMKKGTMIVAGWNKISVICLSTNEVFHSIKEAAKKYNIKSSANIIECCKGCNGRQHSAGKHPITGEKLRWMYYEDYLKFNEEVV